MTPSLVVKEGPLAGRRIEVDAELVVGREDAGLTIEDEEISRRHAAFRLRDGALEIEDLGSTNGTHVNGSRISGPTRLSGGDSVKLGKTVLEVEAARAAATVASLVQAAPAAPAGRRSAPLEPFGAYAAPAAGKRSRGVASRQLGPQLVSFAVVAATAVALVLYFAQR